MSNVELHKEAHRRMSDESPERAAEFFGEDIVFTDEPRGSTLKGKGETTGWLAEWKRTFSDARITEGRYLDAGEWTIARFRGRGVNDGPLGELPPSGRQLDLPFCELCRWQDGKIVEGAIYYDTGTMMVQLGHMSPPA
jgi:hypothetical protein